VGVELGKGETDESRGELAVILYPLPSGRGGRRDRLQSLGFGQQPQPLHDHQGLHAALPGGRGCVNGIERRSLADRRQQRRFAQIKLGHRLAKI